MTKLNFSLILLIIFSLALFSCKKDSDENVNKSHVLGLWQIKNEQILLLKGNDTISNDSYPESRKIEFQNNSVLLMYWNYPNDFDISTWQQIGADSLLIKSGSNAKIHYDFRYKFKLINDAEMTWEETEILGSQEKRKTIYDVIKL